VFIAQLHAADRSQALVFRTFHPKPGQFCDEYLSDALRSILSRRKVVVREQFCLAECFLGRAVIERR